MSDKPESAAGISSPRLAGSAYDARRMALHEAICRCPKCRGTIDKTNLCPTCAETDVAIDAMKPNVPVRRGTPSPQVAGSAMFRCSRCGVTGTWSAWVSVSNPDIHRCDTCHHWGKDHKLVPMPNKEVDRDE